MNDTPAPRATGCLLALAVIAGAFIGARYGQPSLGLVIGLGIGALISVAAWALDRRR